MKGVFDVTFQSALDVFNYGLVLIYGLFLSVSIAGGCTEKRDKKLVVLLCPAFLVLQSLFALTLGTDKTMQLYPLIVHLPLVLILTLALKKPLGVAVVSTCTAYLCCQLRRWAALLVIALFPTGGTALQDATELVVTLPLLLALVHWIAPSVRALSHSSLKLQLQFGVDGSADFYRIEKSGTLLRLKAE